MAKNRWEAVAAGALKGLLGGIERNVLESKKEKKKEEADRALNTFLTNMYKTDASGNKTLNGSALGSYLSLGEDNPFISKDAVRYAIEEANTAESQKRADEREERTAARANEKVADLAKKQFGLNYLSGFELAPETVDETITDPTIGPLRLGVPRTRTEKRIVKTGDERLLEYGYRLSDPSKPAPTEEELKGMVKGAKRRVAQKPVQKMISKLTGALHERNPETGEWEIARTPEGAFVPGRVGGKGGGGGKLSRWEIEKQAENDALNQLGEMPSEYDQDATRRWLLLLKIQTTKNIDKINQENRGGTEKPKSFLDTL